MQGCDTLVTRRQRALHGAKPPPPPVSSALQGPRVRLGRRWVAEARQLHTRKVPRRNKSRPTRTTPRRFGTKLSQHTPLAPHVRYKTLPARAARPHFRYKTLPAHPKWLDLALFLHAGRVLYRCHRQEAEQGEFCTERGAELGLANRTPGPTGVEGAGGTGVEGAGGQGRSAGGRWRGLAAVPVDNGARPRRPWITGPGRSTHKQQEYPSQANFACNSPTTRIHARSKTAEYQRSDFNT